MRINFLLPALALCASFFLASCEDNPEIVASSGVSLEEPRNLFALNEQKNQFEYFPEGSQKQLKYDEPCLLGYDNGGERILVTRSEKHGIKVVAKALQFGSCELCDANGRKVEPLCVFLDKETKMWGVANDKGKVLANNLGFIPKKLVENGGDFLIE